MIGQVERCRNPFWLGTPHATTESLTYNGHFIPKGTVVVLNTWTMHHNADRYPEPEKFNVGTQLPTETLRSLVRTWQSC